jgi:hypothetical protein
MGADRNGNKSGGCTGEAGWVEELILEDFGF